MESHYARLSDVRYRESTPSSDTQTLGSFQFYETQLDEVRARSQSRNRCRSRSQGRERSSNRSPSRGRSCSKSREIVALYTKQQNSRDRSNSHERISRQESLKSTTSVQNNKSTRSTTKQADELLNHKHAAATNFVTLLEMDSERSAEIERDLMLSNASRPADVKMMIIANHLPSKDWAGKDEISVKAGEIVMGMYKQNDWVFIRTSSNEVGFVPYSFTKPVKVSSIERPQKPKRTQKQNDLTPEIYVKNTKPIAGILKNSKGDSKLKKQVSPRYSVKVQTSAGDTESMSSENGSYQSEFVYSRQKYREPAHADCIVVDIDDHCQKVNSPTINLHGSEDLGTYCSDSGISDPSSNNSDDIDMLNSPTGFANMHSQKKLSPPIRDIPKRSNERIKFGATRPFEAKISRCSQPNQKHYESITQMPLGPLGQRLAKMSVQDQTPIEPNHKTLSSKMKDRAKSTNMPAILRPEIPKDYTGPRVTVIYDYSADNEDDLEVKASDIVTVLNAEDIEWIWVQRRDGKEGFIPREYVIPIDVSSTQSRQGLVSAL